MTRSAFSIISLDFPIPIDSILSSDSLIPAVSIMWSNNPSRLISPSTISLVVPGISVTIALSSFNNAFKREDLPTLGFPTSATLTPSRIKLALVASFFYKSNSLIILFTFSFNVVLVTTSISSYSG